MSRSGNIETKIHLFLRKQSFYYFPFRDIYLDSASGSPGDPVSGISPFFSPFCAAEAARCTVIIEVSDR